MKRSKKLLTLMLMANCMVVSSLKSVATPYYSTRSHGVNAARHLVGLTEHLFKLDMDKPYGTLTITPEYTRTFRPQRIAHCLFSDHLINNDFIKISGSRVANRSQQDWLADYFYLPNQFESTINFKPIIDSFLVDFGFYFGLDQWVQGLYFMAHAPVVHTRWNLRMCENIINRGVQPHPAGLFTPAQFNRGDMLTDFSAYAQGKEVGPIEQTVPAATPALPNTKKITVVMQQLKKAKISCKRLKRTRVADLRAAIGWNFLRDEYHVGFHFQFAAPTGNRPNGNYLFEPIIGNGHHWEVGGNINAHYNVWYNDDETKKIALYFDANLTHLFETIQKRTFDLKNNGSFSRYMLAQKLGTPIKDNLSGAGITPSAQFKTEFTPVANLTNINVAVSSAIQADIVLMANFSWDNFSCDVGYNFWARSCENICARGQNVLDNNTTWALKGDAQVFGFASAIDAGNPLGQNPLVVNQPIALSATQSKSTINSGLNKADVVNVNIDNPQLATAGGNNTALNNTSPAAGGAQINTSIQPIFIKESDLNLCDGRTKGLSSKFFGHLNYTGKERHGWLPQIGVGGELEFDHGSIKCTQKCTDGCFTCNPSQWGLWVKIGFSFE